MASVRPGRFGVSVHASAVHVRLPRALLAALDEIGVYVFALVDQIDSVSSLGSCSSAVREVCAQRMERWEGQLLLSCQDPGELLQP